MPEAEDVSPERLPDDAVVVRGGLMIAADLVLGAQSHFDARGIYALSVFSVPGISADEIARGVPLPHSMIRESTTGRLRAAGYEVVRSPGPPGHADLMLPNPPTDDDWRALDAAFDPPRPNPTTMRTDDA
jgi:hypothetical protein